MRQEELNEILERHKKWLNNEIGGDRADLTGVNLAGVNLTGVNLIGVNLAGVNLTGVNLIGVNLTGVNLIGANLTGANLIGANFDYSVWPLWCGTAKSSIKVCDKLKAQLLYHAFIVSSDNAPIPTPEQLAFIKDNFHRYNEVEGLAFKAESKQ